MKKKILKKGVSLLTATALVAGMLNGMENLFTKNVEAAEVVKYEPKVAGVNLIPLRMTNNSNFMRNYVLKKDGYNITKKYSAQSWKKLNGKINSGDGLSTDRKYWHSGNEHWEANFKFDCSGYSNLCELIDSGQIEKGYRTYLTSDYHKHIGRHSGKKWDVAVLSMENDSVKSEGKDDEQGQLYEGKANVKEYTREFKWNMSHEGCNCGSSAVSGSVIYLTDNVEPKVTNVYMSSDSDGSDYISTNTGFMANQTGYVVMKFNENIRFANGTKEVLNLNLELFGTENDQQVTGDTVTASLISLKEDKMIFKFKVPEKLNNKKCGDR